MLYAYTVENPRLQSETLRFIIVICAVNSILWFSVSCPLNERISDVPSLFSESLTPTCRDFFGLDSLPPGAGDEIQGLVYARQGLYHRDTSPALFI